MSDSTKTPTDTQLYHGTDHFFKPGETVIGNHAGSISSSRTVDQSWKDNNNVYSTASLDEAKDYAAQKATSRFAPVYEVNNNTSHSAYGLLEGDPILGRAGWRGKYKNTHISQQPLQPGRIVGWGESSKHTHISPQFSGFLHAYSAMTGLGKAPEIK
jgi:hypothetical protein